MCGGCLWAENWPRFPWGCSGQELGRAGCVSPRLSLQSCWHRPPVTPCPIAVPWVPLLCGKLCPCPLLGVALRVGFWTRSLSPWGCSFPSADAHLLPSDPRPGPSLRRHLDRHRRKPPECWQQRHRHHRGTALCLFMVRGHARWRGTGGGSSGGGGTPKQSSHIPQAPGGASPSETSLCQRLQEEPKEQGFFSKSTKP